MCRKFDVADRFSAGGIDNRQSAIPVAKPGEFGFRIESQIVRVIETREAVQDFIIRATKDFEAAILAIGDEDLILLRQVKNTGGFGHPTQALDASPCGEVNHFQSVIAYSSDKEALVSSVYGQMSKAACDARQRDALYKLERGRRARLMRAVDIDRLQNVSV